MYLTIIPRGRVGYARIALSNDSVFNNMVYVSVVVRSLQLTLFLSFDWYCNYFN